MIEKLALDIAYLTKRRQEAITRVFDEQILASISDTELTLLVQGLRSGDANKQLAFSHVVARYAEQFLASLNPPPEKARSRIRDTRRPAHIRGKKITFIYLFIFHFRVIYFHHENRDKNNEYL